MPPETLNGLLGVTAWASSRRITSTSGRGDVVAGAQMGQASLKPASAAALREWPVTKRLNSTGQGDDDPTMIERAAA